MTLRITDVQRVILAFLQEHPGTTATAIARDLDVPRHRVTTALDTLLGYRLVGRQPPLFSTRLGRQEPFKWFPTSYSVSPSPASDQAAVSSAAAIRSSTRAGNAS